jgi:hypothetical protein
VGERPFGPNSTTTSNFGERKLSWTAPVDAIKFAVYAAPAGNSAKFLADIDAGLSELSVLEVTATEAFFRDLHIIPTLTSTVGLPDGIWQFAVCAIDTAGNYSDPHQSFELERVKIKLTPPHPPKTGDLD